MSERFGAESGASIGDPAPLRRRGHLPNSLLWAAAIVVGLIAAALLTQFGTWGLWAGVVLALVVLAGVVILLGAGWRRGGLAAIACVLGFAAMLFAGPAAYEQYIGAFGEPVPAVVVAVEERGERPGLNSRRCTVVDVSGEVHRLDQRQNCFDHISEGQTVNIFQDPRGLVPPRLADADDDRATVTSVTTAIAAGLLAATALVVFYGGLRRRSAAGHGPDDRREDHEVERLVDDGADTSKTRVLWLERRGAAHRDPKPGPAEELRGDDDSVWEVRGSDAGVRVPEHVDVRVVAYPAGAGDDPRGGIVLWADRGGSEVFARVAAEPRAVRRAHRYLVTDANGATLATITYRKAAPFSIRRHRWTVEQTGRPPIVGHVGRLMSRPMRVAAAPLLVLGFIISLISLDSGAPERRPPRVSWRAGRDVVLEHGAGRSDPADPAGRLHVLSDGWNLRVTAALATLIRRHDPRKKYRWEE